MSDKSLCSCPSPSWAWRLATNEDGWFCVNCSGLAPGEPPGYRPDLDRAELGSKVETILLALHESKLVYVSNGTDGDCYVAAVVKEAIRSDFYDQCSIVDMIMDQMTPRHAAYWRKVGEGVLAGGVRRTPMKGQMELGLGEITDV